MARVRQLSKASMWLVGLAVAGTTWVTPAAVLADGPQPNAPWPQQKRDGPRTGVGGVSGPSNPTASWSYNTGSAIVSGPVVSADGTIYIGMENFRVRAIRPNGTQQWEYILSDSGGGQAPTQLLINSKGRIVFGTQSGYIVGLETDGDEDWKFDTRNAPYGNNDRQAVRGAPGAASNYGRVTVGTDAGILYELEDGAFAGVRRSESDGAIRAGAAVTPDGTVVWGTIGRALRGGSSTGGDKWRLGVDGAVVGTLAVGRDSTTYAGTEAGSVYAVDTDGKQRWRVRLGDGRAVRSAPAVGQDGTVYVGSDEGRLFALDPATGDTKWSFPTQGALTAAPTVGANGLIYLGSNDGRLYVLTADGRAQAQFQADGPIDFSAPAIGADGTLYVGTRSGTLYALKEGAPLTPAASPTPAVATPAPAALPSGTVPSGFAFIRCASGRIYALNSDGSIGQYITSPAALGSGPILQSSDTVPTALIDAVCGSGR